MFRRLLFKNMTFHAMANTTTTRSIFKDIKYIELIGYCFAVEFIENHHYFMLNKFNRQYPGNVQPPTLSLILFVLNL